MYTEDGAKCIFSVCFFLFIYRDNLSHSETIWAKCSSDLMDTDRKIEEGKKLYSELITEKQQLTESEYSWSHQVSNLIHYFLSF